MPGPGNDHGAILTVGVVSNGDRTAIVIPLFNTVAALDKTSGCADIVDGFTTSLLPELQACMSDDAYVSFLQAEGMADGYFPFRSDFLPTAFPGTIVSAAMPSNVTGLLYFYGDPADYPAGHRLVTSRNFLPGVPTSKVVGDKINPVLKANYDVFAQHLISTFAGGLSGNPIQRAMASVRTAGGTIVPCIVAGERDYVATQRRRLIPHS